MQADRQTDRQTYGHTNRNTLHPYQRQSKKSMQRTRRIVGIKTKFGDLEMTWCGHAEHTVDHIHIKRCMIMDVNESERREF